MIDFIGIGAQRCGTTWLFENLSRHPAVHFPAGKEVHFWDKRRNRSDTLWTSLFRQAPGGVIQGEITPAYSILEPDTIRKVFEVVPEARLFYSVRNPMERAWSHALMELRKREISIENASDAWFLDHFDSAASQKRGDFANCLTNWFAVFPRQQIHVMSLDDIKRSPLDVLTSLAAYLGIDPGFYRGIELSVLREPVHQSPRVNIRPSLRDPLCQSYARKILHLSDLLDKDFTSWLRYDN